MFVSIASLAFAADYDAQFTADRPATGNSQAANDVPTASDQNAYAILIFIYKLGLALIGVSSVFMISWGGLKRIYAAGNPSKISEANTKITNAIWGIVLALSSYIILYTINPHLVQLNIGSIQIPALQSANPNIPNNAPLPPGSIPSTGDTCPSPYVKDKYAGSCWPGIISSNSGSCPVNYKPAFGDKSVCTYVGPPY